MNVLGIESSCDETAASVVLDGKKVLSNVIFSQMDLHKEFGGVVPELACRKHAEVIIDVIHQALKEAHITLDAIDLIGVTHGPGLVGALMIGLNTAKALAMAKGIPFVVVNHLEAHLYASMMEQDVSFPALGTVISGGHSVLCHILAPGKYRVIGHTVDDAVGEAFDKVASLLDLPYPGGPSIEKYALGADPKAFSLKAGSVKNHPYHFSFSGLKTAVLYTLKGSGANKKSHSLLNQDQKKDLAASFQETALLDIVQKTLQAAKDHNCQDIFLGGGVTHNKRLKALFEEKKEQERLFWPPPGMSLDNAAMIAGLAYQKYLEKGASDAWNLDVCSRLHL